MAHILIVDDDPTMLGFLEIALEAAGHTTTKHDNGIDALQALKEDRSVELLLTDVVMPGMDGIELSRAAKALYPALKIIFITGFSAHALGDKTPENGAPSIMAKPFHLNDLVKSVEEALKA